MEKKWPGILFKIIQKALPGVYIFWIKYIVYQYEEYNALYNHVII